VHKTYLSGITQAWEYAILISKGLRFVFGYFLIPVISFTMNYQTPKTACSAAECTIAIRLGVSLPKPKLPNGLVRKLRFPNNFNIEALLKIQQLKYTVFRLLCKEWLLQIYCKTRK